MPRCVRVQCPDPSSPRSEYKVGSVASYRSNSGHLLWGNSTRYILVGLHQVTHLYTPVSVDLMLVLIFLLDNLNTDTETDTHTRYNTQKNYGRKYSTEHTSS